LAPISYCKKTCVFLITNTNSIRIKTNDRLKARVPIGIERCLGPSTIKSVYQPLGYLFFNDQALCPYKSESSSNKSVHIKCFARPTTPQSMHKNSLNLSRNNF